MPLQQTSGAASYDAFGGGVAAVPNYIEDVFSTWLYTGNGSTQTINNGIDLAGKGGLTWFKERSVGAGGIQWGHALFSGIGGYLRSQSTDAVSSNSSVSNTSSGFALNDGGARWNASGITYVSWTLRRQPKFFDCVTYTGNGAGPQVINHNLGSAPGCVIVKSVSNTSVWWVWHRGNGGSTDLTGIELNSTSASTFQNAGVASDFTATTFNAGSLINVALNLNPNVNGQQYVAYLFAHNAGGFGLTGTDNVISCGSYTGNGSTTGPVIDLGYEPQWVMIKNASATGNWLMQDVMRGMPVGGSTMTLFADLSNAEVDPGNSRVQPTATGFQIANTASSSLNTSGNTYIYIAIRRGPMKVPTTGTSVFAPVQYTTSPEGFITGFPVDFGIAGNKSGTDKWYWQSRLQGASVLNSASTAAEVGSGSAKFDMMNGYGTGFSTEYWTDAFRRAPGFMDVCCYTGTGAATRTLNHNLGVSPELVIIKARSNTANWTVWNSKTANGVMILNGTDALDTSASEVGNPTSTTFDVKVNGSSTYDSNWSGYTYVAYLFASCPGVSKVFNFTGNGSSQTINCGFTGGARFVMIKRTDSTGDWYVWDSARGIVSGNDPRLSLNTTAAEVTTDDSVDTDSTGFIVNQLSATNVNVNAATYIGIAIA